MRSTPDGAGSGTKRRDPRVDRTRAAVLESARELLTSEGWDAVTQQRVADVSGVGRATLYRHWPDRASLLYEVLAAEELHLHVPPTGDVRRDLIEHLELFARTMSDPALGRVITTIVDRAEWDPGVMDIKVKVARQTMRYLRAQLQQGIDTGVLRADIDISRAAAHLYGPITFRRLVSSEPLGRRFVASVVDDFLTLHRA